MGNGKMKISSLLVNNEKYPMQKIRISIRKEKKMFSMRLVMIFCILIMYLKKDCA